MELRIEKKKWLAAGLMIATLACGRQEEKQLSAGEKIFKQYCILCHGADGKLGLNGAKDLTATVLSEDERIALVTKGKNTMTPFESILTPDQIRAVVAYTFTFKK